MQPTLNLLYSFMNVTRAIYGTRESPGNFARRRIMHFSQHALPLLGSSICAIYTHAVTSYFLCAKRMQRALSISVHAYAISLLLFLNNAQLTHDVRCLELGMDRFRQCMVGSGRLTDTVSLTSLRY